MKKSLKRPEYAFSRGEELQCALEGGLLIVFLAVFFYRSLWAAPFLLPVFFFYRREKKRTCADGKKKKTAEQFKDAILSVSAGQKAGYSVENAFLQAYGDMERLYGKDSVICRELHRIGAGLGNNITLERLLADFAARSRVEDIMEFAEVFGAAKRSGGNMTEIITGSVSVIEAKIETEKEIQVLLSARQMEQKIMNVIPFGIVLYISATSRGFFDVLYHNAAGTTVMTACLAIYTAAVLLSRRIVRIEV